MKRLGKSLILVYIILTVLVLIAQPTMHKPATLERVDFKIKNELLKPRPRVVSDLEIRIRFNRSRPVVVQEDDRSRYITSDDDDRQLAFEMSGDNTTFKDTTFQLQDNIGSRRDVDVDTSSAGSSYSERFLSSQDRDLRQRDMQVGLEDTGMSGRETFIGLDSPSASRDLQVGLEDQGVKHRDMEIGFEDQDVSKSDMVLENVDEVGHKQFKGSRDELIAWNVWRSNLQNQIMMESSIEAPVGTLITFSFNVSAQGNITNLKYSCSNKKYAKEARADMVRVLQNLRYTEILKFPSNTKRTNVKFKGAFLLDYSTSFSKPSDYSDYERVRY